jgi:hypothetical protein
MFGARPGSFRAESHEFISALLFLQAHSHYFDTAIDPNLTHDFCCNSESLLKRIRRALTRSWVNPSHCLASDFDLKSGILELLINNLSISFQHLHVKSHQDDDTEIHLLPWAAQMNVHADSLGTDFLDNCAEPSKLVPFIPASQASLTIHGETITRRFATRLRHAANSPRLCQHLMAKNEWSIGTFLEMPCTHSRTAPGSSLSNSLMITTCQPDATCIGSKRPPTISVQPARTSPKPLGTSLAATVAHPAGVLRCSAHWATPSQRTTPSSLMSLSFSHKVFAALFPTIAFK